MATSTRHRLRGFTLLELLLVIAVITVLASVQAVHLLSTRKSANETSAISSLRLIASAQENYRARTQPSSFGTLEQLEGMGLLDPQVATGRKSGYTFKYPAPPGPADYVILANPDGIAGDRYFYMDSTGVIRAEYGEPATRNSPLVQ